MERTEQDILLAFNRLIARTEIEKIRVQDIADEAKVGRATFYRYFRDKYDVLNANYRELLDSCVLRSGNFRDLFFLLFTHAQKEWGDFHRAFKSSGVNSFENFIAAYSRTLVERIVAGNRPGAGLSAQEELQMDVFLGGVSGMYRKWTLGEYSLSPDEAADALFVLLPERLRNEWLAKESAPSSAENTLT